MIVVFIYINLYKYYYRIEFIYISKYKKNYNKYFDFKKILFNFVANKNFIKNYNLMEELLDVKSARLEKLNNDEFAQFISSVLTLVEETTLEKLNLKQSLIDTLKKYQDDLTEASRQSRYNEDTNKIVELDKQRGRLVVFLLNTFRNERNNVVEIRKESANILYNISKNFSGIQLLPSRQKTQSINAFLKDLSSGIAKQHIDTLGVSEAITSLSDMNTECQKLIEGRAENQLSSVMINTRTVRKEASKLFRLLSRYVSATYLLTESKESANFINLLNKLITDTTNANKKRLAQSNINKSNTPNKQPKN